MDDCIVAAACHGGKCFLPVKLEGFIRHFKPSAVCPKKFPVKYWHGKGHARFLKTAGTENVSHRKFKKAARKEPPCVRKSTSGKKKARRYAGPRMLVLLNLIDADDIGRSSFTGKKTSFRYRGRRV